MNLDLNELRIWIEIELKNLLDQKTKNIVNFIYINLNFHYFYKNLKNLKRKVILTMESNNLMTLEKIFKKNSIS